MIKIIIPISMIILVMGCYVTEPYGEDEYFESGYYLKTTMGDFRIYRSSRYVGVRFVEDTPPKIAEELTDEYYLTPVTMMEHRPDPRSWDAILDETIIIMKLPKGARLNNYLSNYPRTKAHSFGDLPEVQFCLPTYSSHKKGGPESRIYINDEIIARSPHPIDSLKRIVDEYGLELLQETDWGNYYNYKFRIGHNSPMNTLDLANDLFDMNLFDWATPNKWVYIQPGGYDVY